MVWLQGGHAIPIYLRQLNGWFALRSTSSGVVPVYAGLCCASKNHVWQCCSSTTTRCAARRSLHVKCWTKNNKRLKTETKCVYGCVNEVGDVVRSSACCVRSVWHHSASVCMHAGVVVRCTYYLNIAAQLTGPWRLRKALGGVPPFVGCDRSRQCGKRQR